MYAAAAQRRSVDFDAFNIEVQLCNDSQKNLSALQRNEIWTTVERPTTNVIRSKWVFKLKKDAHGDIQRYKARLVAVGTSQVYDMDYSETFSPVEMGNNTCPIMERC